VKRYAKSRSAQEVLVMVNERVSLVLHLHVSEARTNNPSKVHVVAIVTAGTARKDSLLDSRNDIVDIENPRQS
jgi:hypothetical protein